MIIGFFIQMIWIQLEDISFMVINSLVQISIPGLPSTIQSFLMKYIFFDILYTELWITKFMDSIGIEFDKVKNDTALNVQFSDNGFNSKQFLKNSGSSFFFLSIYVFSWVILLLLSLLSRRWIKLNSLKDKLSKQLKWKQSLNFLMNQFPILLQCSLLNFYDMRLQDQQAIAKLSSILSILVFIALMAALIMIFWKVFRLTKNLNHIQITEFNETYSPLTESLKESKVKKIIYFWKPLYLLRWTLTIFVLTTIQDHSSFQILCLLVFSGLQQYLILTSRPYSSRALNIITFINEVAVSFYLYLSFMLSDYLETQIIDNQPLLSSLKLQIAWVLTCVLLTTILINFLYALFHIATGVFRYVKSKIKCKRKVEVKKIKEQSSSNKEFEKEKKEPIIEGPQTKYQEAPQVDITANSDFTKLGYESYEYYPGSYSFPKVKEEVKNEEEKKNSVFNFYDHI